LIARSVLVLPTPLRPNRQVIWPTSAVSETCHSAWLAP
jgi:hypothetical protein